MLAVLELMKEHKINTSVLFFTIEMLDIQTYDSFFIYLSSFLYKELYKIGMSDVQVESLVYLHKHGDFSSEKLVAFHEILYLCNVIYRMDSFLYGKNIMQRASNLLNKNIDVISECITIQNGYSIFLYPGKGYICNSEVVFDSFIDFFFSSYRSDFILNWRALPRIYNNES